MSRQRAILNSLIFQRSNVDCNANLESEMNKILEQQQADIDEIENINPIAEFNLYSEKSFDFNDSYNIQQAFSSSHIHAEPDVPALQSTPVKLRIEAASSVQPIVTIEYSLIEPAADNVSSFQEKLLTKQQKNKKKQNKKKCKN